MNNLKQIVLLGCVLAISVMTSGCNDKKLEVPGETKVSAYYAYNLVPMIKTYIDLGIVDGCKEIKVLDTKILKASKDKNPEWTEMWLVDACGKNLEVPIKFVESGDKVQSLIRSGEIKEKVK